MRAAFALVLASLFALPGCGLGGGEASDRPGRMQERSGAERGEEGARREPREPEEAERIREWSTALNAGNYARAASFFAEGAIVEQTAAVRLPDRAAAIAFNRSLPCRADVTEIDDEGDTILATFRLREGPGGGCDGGARVRFRFRDGKFAEWRQLAEPAEPGGDITHVGPPA